MRRIIIILLVLVVLGGGGWYAYQRYQTTQAAAEAGPSYETITISRGSIASTVNATGNIEPQTELSLSFRTTGRVAQVLVMAGQSVAAGQLLATLDTTDLTLALAQAKVSLEISQAQLAKLIAPPSTNDIAAAQAGVVVAQGGVAGAEAALESAQASYRQLLVGPTAAQRTVNLAQVRQAEANLKRAQQAYNQVKNQPNIGELPQSSELEQVTVAYEVAKAQAALTEEGANQAEIAAARNQIVQAEVQLRQAQSNVVTAQNNLQTLLNGADEEDVRVAQAQVRQAQLSQLQAENSLSSTQLTASTNGVISQVNVRQGELTGALPAIVLTNLDSFHMTVLVDEIDVRQVAVGQTVRLRVDALPDRDLTGRVTEIAPVANNVSGVIAYEVTVTPDPSDAPLRAGMSATAIITTAQVDNVILLPNRFIQLDRETDQAFVYKMVNNQPVLQEVELGLRNEQESQILAGLNDGDSVALVSRSAGEQLRQIFGGD